MCGISGVVGSDEATREIMAGLEVMSPRGTDSAGILLIDREGGERICKAAGRPAFLGLKEKVDRLGPFAAVSGIGHIRWATQGRVTEANAHPHRAGDWAIVHNGNVDHASLDGLRASIPATLIAADATDTSLIVMAWSRFCASEEETGRLVTCATLETFLAQVQGTNAFVLLNVRNPDQFFVAVQGAAELYVASGKNGAVHVVSSPRAFEGIATTYYAVPSGAYLFERGQTDWPGEARVVDLGAKAPSMTGFDHLMQMELHHVPTAVRRVLEAVNAQSLRALLPARLLDPTTAPDEIVFLACGSSLYAAETAATLFEASFHCSVRAIDATATAGSTVRLYGLRPLLIVLSQSGTTSDTLMALDRCREACSSAQRAELVTMGVHNNPMGALAHRVDVSLYTHTGEERATASTMAFFGQSATLLLLLGALRNEEVLRYTQLEQLVPLLEVVRELEAIRVLASAANAAPAFLLLALGGDLPIAREGGLKLKEIAYLMTEAMAAGNLKHGPLALIHDKAHVIILAPKLPGDEARYDRLVGATKDVLTREGRVIFLTTDNNTDFRGWHDHLTRFSLPLAQDVFSQGLLLVYVLQFLAFELGDLRGHNVDNPRHLAKTVTVQ